LPELAGTAGAHQFTAMDRRLREARRAGESVTYDVFLDCRGMVCPMPLVKTRQALMVVGPGATVCVVATDPASMADFESFCEATGHKLLRSEQDERIYLYVIEKA
jgi:tRNA 2-thiouridine synthesizing protein A